MSYEDDEMINEKCICIEDLTVDEWKMIHKESIRITDENCETYKTYKKDVEYMYHEDWDTYGPSFWVSTTNEDKGNNGEWFQEEVFFKYFKSYNKNCGLMSCDPNYIKD